MGVVCLYPLSHLIGPPAVHLQARYLTTLSHAFYFCIMLAALLKGSFEEITNCNLLLLATIFESERQSRVPESHGAHRKAVMMV